MAKKLKQPARDDASRPPLFSLEEWQAVVRTLGLSPRQAQVVGYAIQSRKDKEIARLLTIDETTVYTHIKIAKSRLNALDRVGLAYRVFECFLYTVERRHPQK